MTDKPILFSAPMIRALLDGRKTQTRRIIKNRGWLPEFCGGRYDGKNDPSNYGWEDYDRGEWITLDQFRTYRFVRYAPGDRLWVREAHAFVPATAYRMSEGVAQVIDPTDRDRACIYREGWERSKPGPWRSSIHMPRWASRLTLVVTNVRVQRLQEISEEDARAEGVRPDRSGGGMAGMYAPLGVDPHAYARGFRDLWNSIYGQGAWDQDPWVAAISFTVHKCNIDQMEATT